MRDHTWNEAEKHFGLVHKTLRKCLVSGDFDPSVYDKRQTYVGANNPTAVRVIRLTDQKVYETGRQAAQDIGVADTGVWAAIRYGTPSRGHHFMRYDEWIAAGKPNAHPSVPGPVGVNSR